MILVLERNLRVWILLKFRIKVKIPFWASVETPDNSTSVTLVLVSFKYTHSCFHHFDFVN